MPLTGSVIRTYYTDIMSEEIIKKLNEHDQRFDEHDKRFSQIDQRFDEHDKRFDQLDDRVDFIARKVLEHDDRLDRIEENMATKADIGRVMDTLDTLVGLFTTTEQELIFMGERVKRVEAKAEKNTQNIAQIQPLVGLR